MATVTDLSVSSRTWRNSLSSRPTISREASKVWTDGVPWWRTDVTGSCRGQGFFDIDTSGVLAGTVKFGPTPVPFAAVHLYHRPTGILINKTLCDSAGAFAFKGLDKFSTDYFAVALDSPYNAQVFDRLNPA